MAETILNWGPLVIALLGGILPALVWLWFWRRFDCKNPEPTGLIALSFAAGMAVVFFILPVQQLVVTLMPFIMDGINLLAAQFSFVPPVDDTLQSILWSFTEEFGKFATVFLVAYHTRDFDEPMDCVIYLITAALGFAAMENALYLLKDFAHGGVATMLLDSNLRFIGATILHIVTAAILGIAFAFSFYGKLWLKFIAGFIGIMLATLLHAYFNLSIMDAYGTLGTLTVFVPFWGAIVGIIILLQIVTRIKNPNEKNTL